MLAPGGVVVADDHLGVTETLGAELRRPDTIHNGSSMSTTISAQEQSRRLADRIRKLQQSSTLQYFTSLRLLLGSKQRAPQIACCPRGKRYEPSLIRRLPPYLPRSRVDRTLFVRER